MPKPRRVLNAAGTTLQGLSAPGVLHATEGDVAQDLVLTACLWVAEQQLHAASCLALGCIGEKHIHAIPVAAHRYKSRAAGDTAAGYVSTRLHVHGCRFQQHHLASFEHCRSRTGQHSNSVSGCCKQTNRLSPRRDSCAGCQLQQLTSSSWDRPFGCVAARCS